ncbi:MAG: four helix bundle protein [Planctomycetota bacterium]
MASFERYQEINAWQKARVLMQKVCDLFRDDKLRREFWIKDQMLRSTLSIMNNIAEGFGRSSKKEFARFLDIAKASALETQSMVYVVQDIGHVSEATTEGIYTLADEIIRMISSLTRYLRQSPKQN